MTDSVCHAPSIFFINSEHIQLLIFKESRKQPVLILSYVETYYKKWIKVMKVMIKISFGQENP